MAASQFEGMIRVGIRISFGSRDEPGDHPGNLGPAASSSRHSIRSIHSSSSSCAVMVLVVGHAGWPAFHSLLCSKGQLTFLVGSDGNGVYRRIDVNNGGGQESFVHTHTILIYSKRAAIQNGRYSSNNKKSSVFGRFGFSCFSISRNAPVACHV